jgi:hypothetical protein
MKRFLYMALVCLSLSAPAFAQREVVPIADVEKSRLFTASATGSCWEVPTGVGYHTIRWVEVSAISAGTVKLQGSNDSACATVADIIAAQGITSSGKVVATAGEYKYVQLVVASHAGGPLEVYYAGNKSAASGGSAVTVTSGDLTSITNAVTVTDGAGALNVICDSGCSGGTQYTQDAALTVATTVGPMAVGRASAAAPADVTADNDAVIPWYLRSGAQAVQLTNSGVLTLSGSGTATGALRVELPTNGTGTLATVGAVTAITNALPAGDNNVGNVDIVTMPADATELPAAAALADATANPTIPAVAAYLMAWNGATWDRATKVSDPCDGAAKTVHVVNMSSAATVEIANAVASQYQYICGVNLVTAAANNVAITTDDTDGCGSPNAGLAGGATAATGWNFAANGGLTLGNGSGTVMKAATANNYLCIMTSAATQLSGTITFVSAP